MYIYLFSMLLSHISLQNYFENFLKSKINPYLFLFQAWRSTGPVDRLCSRPGRSTSRSTESCVQDVHACARLSVDRPVDRPKTACSLFFGGRPTVKNCVCPLRPVDPSPTASCQQGWRSTGPVDRQACQLPTALSSLVKIWILIFTLFCGRTFLTFWGLFSDQINLI